MSYIPKGKKQKKGLTRKELIFKFNSSGRRNRSGEEDIIDVPSRAQEKMGLKSMLKMLTAGAMYRKMIASKEAGWPICVASAGVPIEVFYAMDVFPIFPESLAAISAGTGKAEEFFRAARERAYSNAVCSYTRCGLAISWTNKCPFGPIPPPDLLITDVSLCCLHLTWWNYLGAYFKKPVFHMDMPATDDPSDPVYVDYYEGQIRGMVQYIEKNCGREFRLNKLKEAVSNSDRAGYYWKKIMELRKCKPSPASFRTLSGQILPLVTALGLKEAGDLYSARKDYQTSEGNNLSYFFYSILKRY
jgi:benzoyl-CoA reductase/2-hydroxyglutaryl-CoA dehydratase subunit BcrC/BadD/HgdB